MADEHTAAAPTTAALVSEARRRAHWAPENGKADHNAAVADRLEALEAALAATLEREAETCRRNDARTERAEAEDRT